MCIRFLNKKPKLQEKSVTITENGTTNITPDTGNDGLSSVSVTTNVSGGGATEEKDVNFYDYDGTLLNSYSKNEFLALTSMPENPTHTGLVAQGWNWDLADAKDYVTDYGILDVGQVYTTASGLSEFDIELTIATGLQISLNMTGTKNWGDGTSDTNTTHTYTNYGKYTITCNGTSMMNNVSTSNGLFGQSSSSSRNNSFVKNIRIAEVSTIRGGAFSPCISLKTIILSNSVTTIQDQNFTRCYSLKSLTLPKNTSTIGNALCSQSCLEHFIFNNITSIGSGIFESCKNLSKIIIPKNIQNIGPLCRSCFSSSLFKIILPEATTTIPAYCFFEAYSLINYDFTHVTQVPTLPNTNAFYSINLLAKIVVPDSLYEDWIAASNWTTYASYIIKESDYNA